MDQANLFQRFENLVITSPTYARGVCRQRDHSELMVLRHNTVWPASHTSPCKQGRVRPTDLRPFFSCQRAFAPRPSLLAIGGPNQAGYHIEIGRQAHQSRFFAAPRAYPEFAERAMKVTQQRCNCSPVSLKRAPRPRIAAHVCVASGLEKAFAAGVRIGCDCLLIFVKNQPQWWGVVDRAPPRPSSVFDGHRTGFDRKLAPPD
jgi:hypothetical protein